MKNIAQPTGSIEEILHIYGNILFRMCLVMLGNAVDVSAEPALWDAGKATIEMSAESLPSGRYTLIISEFEGGAKADQPLEIKGNWVCEFEK